MSFKAKKYAISFPLNAQMAANIDEMFQDLYKRLQISIIGTTDLTVGSMTAGDLVYFDGSALAALTAGTVGTILRSAGTATAPAWTSFTVPTTFAQGDVIYGSAANVLSALAKDTNATRYLSNQGASNAPSWNQINLANGVTGDLPYANLAQGSALSVLGVTGNAIADNASIVAGSDAQVLRRSGTSVAFGAVDLAAAAAITGDLPFANLTPASAASKLLGRGDSSAGDYQEITVGTGLAMTGTTLSSTGGGGSGEPTEETTTSTGTVNNYDLDAAFTLLRCNNATDLTLTGFTCIAAAPTAGDRVIIVSVGAGDVYLAHQDTGSTAANRLFNTVTSGHSPLAAGKGSAMYQYDGTTSRWRLVAHTQGAPILVPFNAGDYTANGAMTWAGNNGDPSWFDYKYSVIGSIIFISVSFDAGDIGGTPNIQLQLKMPLTYSPAGIGANFCFIKNAGTKENGRFLAAPGSSNINITKIDQSNFTTQTDTLQIFGELFIPLT